MGISHESRDLNWRISSTSYATFMIAAVFYSTVTASWPSLVTGNIQHPLRKKGALLDMSTQPGLLFFKQFFCKGEHGSFGKDRNKNPIENTTGFSTTLQQMWFWGRLSNAARLWLCCFAAGSKPCPLCLALKNYSINHTLPRIELPKLSISSEVREGSQQARLRRFSFICFRGAQQSGCEL